jgi:hypothetical protein
LFSDESGGTEAIRSLASISGPVEALKDLERDLDGYVRKAGLKELKWSALRTRKARLEAAQGFLESARRAVSQKKVRLDILLWKGGQPFPPMYVKLLTRTAKSWKKAEWSFYPDQHTGVDWKGILKAANRSRRYHYSRFQPLRSSEHSLVQLADLLAGMTRFCLEKSGQLKQWMGRESSARASGPQRTLYNRFGLAWDFFQACQADRLPVQMDKGYFESASSGHLVFWNEFRA